MFLPGMKDQLGVPIVGSPRHELVHWAGVIAVRAGIVQFGRFSKIHEYGGRLHGDVDALLEPEAVDALAITRSASGRLSGPWLLRSMAAITRA